MKKLYAVLIILTLITGLTAGLYFYALSKQRRSSNITPPPKISLSGKKPLVGAYYYTYDGKESPFWQNYLRKKLNIPQQPQLGEYNCREPEIIKQHIAWSQESGIDFFAINWFGPGSTSDVTVKNYFTTYLAQNKTDFKFCLVYQTPYILPFEKGIIVIDREALRLLQNHFVYMANEYFKDPHYLKINNRPVLFLYVSHLLRGEYELAITKTINIVQQRTGYNIFLIGDEIILPEGGGKQAQIDKKRIGLFDAITSYNIWGSPKYDGFPVVTRFFDDLDTVFNNYYNIAGQMDIRFIPNVVPGFNNRGFSLGANYPILPREATINRENEGTTYSVYFNIALKYIDPKLNMLMITSFNGFSDDTQIEPVKSNYLTPASAPIEFVGGYKYYAYHDLYLRITNAVLSSPNQGK